jgi:enamine deaminase RidA (YjgF/YER057c/UK114 family)
MSFDQKLNAMGYDLEPLEMDTERFVQAVKVGDLIFTSGQISSWKGQSLKGKVGRDVSVEQAYEGAKWCTLNALRAVKTIEGSLDSVVRIVKVLGMVNVAADFDDTAGVINGCSDLLRKVFGHAGLHARTAVGVTVPFGWSVEVEMVVQTR